MKAILAIGAISLSSILTGCVVYDSEAHQEHYQRPEIQTHIRANWGVGSYYYDPYLDMYVSYAFPSSYWLDGFYFRYSGDIWYRASAWNGPWLVVSAGYLPQRIHSFRHHYARYPSRYPHKIRLEQYRQDGHYDRHDDHRNARSKTDYKRGDQRSPERPRYDRDKMDIHPNERRRPEEGRAPLPARDVQQPRNEPQRRPEGDMRHDRRAEPSSEGREEHRSRDSEHGESEVRKPRAKEPSRTKKSRPVYKRESRNETSRVRD